ncbi:MAG TPA: DUF2851 family protein [Cyclobacteriaceae bacterium]|nr:DUF2851 family protein [Cyclobacteriaceae bacterium]
MWFGKNDKPVLRTNGTPIPTLELQHRVEPELIEGYKRLVNNPSSIPCENSLTDVDQLTKLSMLDKALMQRLENKASNVLELFHQTGQDWEEVAFQLTARNFGFKINNEPFFALTQSVSRKILLKHSDNLTQVEALLFGQSGFLDYSINDDYLKLLQREYQVLASKYDLEKEKLNPSLWKFMRLRPANFPTMRIAQFSALFCKNKNLFSRMIEADRLLDIRSIFDVSTSDYWHRHYRFGRSTARSISNLGEDSVDNMIINTIAPLLVAYGKQRDEQLFIDRAIEFLQKVPAETNKIVKSWKALNIEARSAFDSQALIELNNNFCIKRRCLSCTIGTSLLKPQVT